MFESMRVQLADELNELKQKGLYKSERVLAGPQQACIELADGRQVLNFCANNYLGLSDHPDILDAARESLDRWGYGLSSVRFICGTQEVHKMLEAKLSNFLGTEDTILYASCFDANGGVFAPLFDERDAIISDALNHASIIDGVRLCKASRLVYKHADMDDLERCLRESKDARWRVIATDGVFSMDGCIAPLSAICDLARRYDALVMVDDSHATGYVGRNGRGTAEYRDVLGRVDLITTTFGKALGGASGGCVSGRREIIDMLRQRSRPYLFSNTLAPPIAAATLRALDMLEESHHLRDKVVDNAIYFRHKMNRAGFDLLSGTTAIVAVMLYDEPLAVQMADRLLDEGIYVIGFTYPVVPRGQARIRVQLSAAHNREHIGRAVGSFIQVGIDLGVLKRHKHRKRTAATGEEGSGRAR
ncbi:MAG: glycine C-acetyltransferase [Candidatus Cloacimonetes bacterium]|nr:glycine C-acetyltransferase [Candidatus Cloacimonadota bacterium]